MLTKYNDLIRGGTRQTQTPQSSSSPSSTTPSTTIRTVRTPTTLSSHCSYSSTSVLARSQQRELEHAAHVEAVGSGRT
eukprot:4606473-Prymnesium_polylepis.1